MQERVSAFCVVITERARRLVGVRWMFALLLVVITANLIMACPKDTVIFKHAQDGEKLVTAMNAFSLDLYKKLGVEKQGANLFFSPASISFALGMTYLGAKNNTAEQMNGALHFSDINPENLHTSLNDLRAALLNSGDDYKLHIANQLYGQQSYSFLQTFLDATNTYYGAEMERVDFAGQTEVVRQQINTWVEDQTANKIKDLIPSGVLNALTRLVLVNAIYFKGDWLSKFDQKMTKEATFFTGKEKKVQIPMMHQTDKFMFGYNQELKAKALELPYKGEKISMLVVLPDDVEGLQALEAGLTAHQLGSPYETFGMHEIKTKVWLPKFKLEDSFSLGETLSQLGMRDLFSAGVADLSGMDGSQELFVSHVVHKAFLNVDEEGSEAAAATAVIVMTRSLPRIMEFKANHPFLFIIRNKQTGAVLFHGRLVEPQGEIVGSSGTHRDDL